MESFNLRNVNDFLKHFKIQYLGLGLYISWIACLHMAGTFPGDNLSYSVKNSLINIFDIATIFGLLIFAQLSRYKENKVFKKLSYPMSILAISGSICLGTITYYINLDALFLNITAAIGGIASSYLLLTWADVYSKFHNIKAIIYASSSCITAFICALTVFLIKQPYALTYVTILIIFSCFLLFISQRADDQSLISNYTYEFPKLLCLLMVIVSFVSGIYGPVFIQNPPAFISSLHRVAATGLLGIFVLLIVIYMPNRFNLTSLAFLTVPATIITCILILFAPINSATFISFTIKFIYVTFSFFALITVRNLAYKHKINPVWLFGIIRAFTDTSIYIGVIFRHELMQLNVASNRFLSFSIVFVLIFLLILSAFVFKHLQNSLRTSKVNLYKSEVNKEEENAELTKNLASIYELSPRESEIVELILNGSSNLNIESTLFISNNTVKTHIRNIYKKLDIHSRKELIDIAKTLKKQVDHL